jgi:hypothetical protein
VHGLRDHHDAALDESAQHHLRHGLSVRVPDLGQDRVGEQIVAALGERSPGLAR